MRDLSLLFPLTISRPRPAVGGNQRLNLILLAAILLLGLGYLFTINALGTKGYEIKRVESRLQNLENEQKNLQIQSGNLQSINQIQGQATAVNFVPVTSVIYIKDGNFAFK